MGVSRRVLLLCVLLAAPQVALADEHPDARNTSIDGNPFHLDPAGQTVLSSGSAQVLGPFEYHLALVGHYVNQPVVGRRAGRVNLLADMENAPATRERALALLERVEQTYGEDIQSAVEDLMMRFV